MSLEPLIDNVNEDFIMDLNNDSDSSEINLANQWWEQLWIWANRNRTIGNILLLFMWLPASPTANVRRTTRLGDLSSALPSSNNTIKLANLLKQEIFLKLCVLISFAWKTERIIKLILSL